MLSLVMNKVGISLLLCAALGLMHCGTTSAADNITSATTCKTCQCDHDTQHSITINCSLSAMINSTDVALLKGVTQVNIVMGNSSAMDISEMLCAFPNMTTIDIHLNDGNLSLRPPCNLPQLETLWIKPVSEVNSVISVNLNISEVSFANNKLSDIPLGLLHGICTKTFQQQQTLREDIFSCYKLHKLNLSYNMLRVIANNSFQSLPWIQILDLSHNLISELDSGFGDQFQGYSLRELNLSFNILEQLVRDSFTGLRGLTKLDISHNSINRIDPGVFTCDLGKDLNILDLSYNQLSSLEPQTLVDLHDLKVLNLSHNRLKYIADKAILDNRSADCPASQPAHVFWPENVSSDGEVLNTNVIWPQFHTLDFSYNNLTWIGDDTLHGPLRNLQVLKFSHNRMSHLPHYAIERLHNLRSLDLSHNDLYWLDVGTFNNDKLEYLDLSYNKLKKIISMAFLYLPRIRLVDLSYNELSYIYKYSFYRSCKYDQPFTVSLKENNLDTDTIWRLLATFRHLEHTSCQLTIDLSNNNITHFVKDVERVYELYLQTRDFRYFSAWNHVKFNLEYNPIVCDCTLYNEVKLLSNIRYAFHANISQLDNLEFWRELNCSNVEQQSLPAVLDKMKCMDGHLNGHCPHHCICLHEENDLLVVNCTGQGLTEVPVLPHASNIELYLSHNRIFEILDEHYFVNVSLIDLSHNALKDISHNAIEHMPHLQNLLLQNNKLEHLPSTIQDLKDLKLVTLSENPFTCQCKDSWLYSWVINNSDIFSDLHQIRCSSGQLFIDISKESFCQLTAGSVSMLHTHLLYLGIGALAALVVLLTGLTSLLFCRRGDGHKFSLVSTFSGMLWDTEKPGNETYRYDVLLGYNAQESGQFIDSVVAALLDQCPALTIAPPLTCMGTGNNSEANGPMDIREQVAQSRCTALVISKGFIDNEWSEFRSSLMDMLHCGAAHNIVLVSSDSEYASLEVDCQELHTITHECPLITTSNPRQCATQLLTYMCETGRFTDLIPSNSGWDLPTAAENTVLVTPSHERY